MYAERVRGGGDRGTVEALVKIENGADASDLATKGDLRIKLGVAWYTSGEALASALEALEGGK